MKIYAHLLKEASVSYCNRASQSTVQRRTTLKSAEERRRVPKSVIDSVVECHKETKNVRKGLRALKSAEGR